MRKNEWIGGAGTAQDGGNYFCNLHVYFFWGGGPGEAKTCPKKSDGPGVLVKPIITARGSCLQEATNGQADSGSAFFGLPNKNLGNSSIKTR